MMDSALHSRYIIDGIPQEFSPAEMLSSAGLRLETAVPEQASEGGRRQTIVDETVDPILETHPLDAGKVELYAELVLGTVRSLPLPYSDVYTRVRISGALIDAIWKKGHFKLGNLALEALWEWDDSPVGARAAFYRSVQAAAEYTDSLGVSIAGYSYRKAVQSGVSFNTVQENRIGTQARDPFLSDSDDRPVCIHSDRIVPDALADIPGSWIIYVPFDTSEFRLGGSVLSQALGFGGGVSPQICDADYFMDCYEVVRELVEDGIVLSGTTVSEGGLMTAAGKWCRSTVGTTLDLADMLGSFEGSDAVRLLFSEVPGVLLQIRDTDFDYVDAEFLLQDVAYFPLGHPERGDKKVKVKLSPRTGLQNILASLMQQKAEGED